MQFQKTPSPDFLKQNSVVVIAGALLVFVVLFAVCNRGSKKSPASQAAAAAASSSGASAAASASASATAASGEASAAAEGAAAAAPPSEAPSSSDVSSDVADAAPTEPSGLVQRKVASVPASAQPAKKKSGPKSAKN